VITRVILITIVLLLVARAITMLVRGVLVGSGITPDTRAKRTPVKLARDPVCGTHVAPRTSLSLTAGGTTHYFCSDECRRTYQKHQSRG
jgi:YHS domain-containing protein